MALTRIDGVRYAQFVVNGVVIIKTICVQSLQLYGHVQRMAE